MEKICRIKLKNIVDFKEHPVALAIINSCWKS